jgi:hypothetical protein
MVLLAGTLVHCLGCGSPHDLVSVEGIVQLEGVPMTGGRILLTPREKGKPSAGTIQSDGSFMLSTYELNDGANPGEHGILIFAAAPGQEDPANNSSEEPRSRRNWMPPEDFTIEIEAGEKNQLTIEVSRASGWQQIADD